jgi:hypothetical protein
MKRYFAVLALAVLVGCGLIPPPEPPVNPCDKCTPEQECVDGTCVDPLPPYTDSCQALLDEGMPWCEPGTPCGDCVHNPTSDPRHCEKLQDCVEPPPVLPEPQCPKFTDRGGTERCQSDACECYCDERYVPCENEECAFPQGIDNEHFTAVPNPGTYGSVVNKAMAELSGCAVGTDCPITFHPDKWMGLVCEVLCVQYGLNCGRHDDTPPGATDQISVKKGDFCDGKLHENYQIYNYGGKKVRWAPGGTQDAWLVDCDEGMPPPEPEPDCPLPHPDMNKMKFNAHEKGNHLDTTLTTVGQPEYCESIGFCCMPGTGGCGEDSCIPRGGCPVRPECGPEVPADAICHDRFACEQELCGQKWECNGAPMEGWRGNPAQTNCKGHYKTWCSNAPNIVLEGDR